MDTFFQIEHTDTNSCARAGVMHTAHGSVQTPVFMPVGTRAAVKTLTPRVIEELDAQIILGNTYHLLTRPGPEIIEEAGGLHSFMSWNGPILTDSGGFQVYSLAALRNIDDTGAVFHSHIDGKRLFLGPRESMQLQKIFGSDIVMAFDECPPSTASRTVIERAVKRSTDWAQVCKEFMQSSASNNGKQHLFAIVQGGTHDDLRQRSAEELCALDCHGYAIGGLAVGEPPEEMYRVTELCCQFLPEEKPRYLMGVGTPEDIVHAVLRGVDMFDCVMPTRNARNGMAFTRTGNVHIKAGRCKDDFSPVEKGCECYTCRTFSRAYIRHLLNVGESLGGQLLTIHNLHFYLRLVRELRGAIMDNTLDKYVEEFFRLRNEGDNK